MCAGIEFSGVDLVNDKTGRALLWLSRCVRRSRFVGGRAAAPENDAGWSSVPVNLGKLSFLFIIAVKVSICACYSGVIQKIPFGSMYKLG